MPGRLPPRKSQRVDLLDPRDSASNYFTDFELDSLVMQVSPDPECWPKIQSEIVAALRVMRASIGANSGQLKPEKLETLEQLSGHLSAVLRLLDAESLLEYGPPDPQPRLSGYEIIREVRAVADLTEVIPALSALSFQGQIIVAEALRHVQKLEVWVDKAKAKITKETVAKGSKPRDPEVRAVAALAKLFDEHGISIKRSVDNYGPERGDSGKFARFARGAINTAGKRLYGANWRSIGDGVIERGRRTYVQNRVK